MSAARIRLIIAALLFGSWLCWLGYLAMTASNPVVLSRPQFFSADLWVIAQVSGAEKPDPKVAIQQVVWNKPDGKKIPGNSIRVVGLDRAELHWQGDGEYFLPLVQRGDMGYQLNPIPLSPGYQPVGNPQTNPMRIYPVTSATQRQVDVFLQAKQQQ